MSEALRGIREYQRVFDRAAGDLSRAVTGGAPASPAAGAPDPDGREPAGAPAGDPVVGATERLLRARHGLAACLAVARVGEETLGSVIDTLA
jgi:hypothetical protein